MNFTADQIKLLMFEMLFVFSFAYYTYTTNIFVIFGFLLIVLYMFSTRLSKILPLMFVLSFIPIFFIYYSKFGFDGGFRVFKTFVIFAPFFVLSGFKMNLNDGWKLLKPLHYFMTGAAVLVCIDFCLYFAVGKTIGSFTESGFMPRPNGFMEDSNFFSYSVVSYIIFLKYTYRKSTKLFIMAVFLSGSFSAIFMLLVLLVIYKMKIFSNLVKYSRKWKFIRYSIFTSVLFVSVSYMSIVSNKEEIINYLEEATEASPLMQVKIRSMFYRFEAQNTAVNIISQSGDELFGGGPGITKTLNERGMNLHNTYYQIFVEMGFVLIILVIFILLYYMLCIDNINFMLLYAVMFLFGNMLEVYYFPLLPFIYFLYVFYQNKVRECALN